MHIHCRKCKRIEWVCVLQSEGENKSQTIATWLNIFYVRIHTHTLEYILFIYYWSKTKNYAVFLLSVVFNSLSFLLFSHLLLNYIHHHYEVAYYYYYFVKRTKNYAWPFIIERVFFSVLLFSISRCWLLSITQKHNPAKLFTKKKIQKMVEKHEKKQKKKKKSKRTEAKKASSAVYPTFKHAKLWNCRGLTNNCCSLLLWRMKVKKMHSLRLNFCSLSRSLFLCFALSGYSIIRLVNFVYFFSWCNQRLRELTIYISSAQIVCTYEEKSSLEIMNANNYIIYLKKKKRKKNEKKSLPKYIISGNNERNEWKGTYSVSRIELCWNCMKCSSICVYGMFISFLLLSFNNGKPTYHHSNARVDANIAHIDFHNEYEYENHDTDQPKDENNTVLTSTFIIIIIRATLF